MRQRYKRCQQNEMLTVCELSGKYADNFVSSLLFASMLNYDKQCLA
jgi:hypothetical protein